MKEGWKEVLLGDVCTVQGGSTPRRTDDSLWKDGTYPWFTVEDIREQGRIITDTKQKVTKKAWDSLRIFPKDTILLCCTASVGEYAITKIDISSNQQFNGITINNKSEISPMYLFYYCSTLKDKLLENSGKATIDFVSGSKVRSLPLKYPSLSEQDRIVKKLDEAFAKIDALKQNAEKGLQAVKDLWQATLKEELKPKEGWKKCKLKDVCSKITDGTHNSPTNTPEGDYMYVTAKNIKKSGLDLSNITYVTEDVHNEIFSRCNPQKGDILYIKDGATTGIAIINPLEEEFSLLSSVALIKTKTEELLNSYLCHYLNSPMVYELVRGKMEGAAITRITIQKIKDFDISMPPLKEQELISLKLDSLCNKCIELQSTYEQELAEYESLKQSILRKAFSGEL